MYIVPQRCSASGSASSRRSRARSRSTSSAPATCRSRRSTRRSSARAAWAATSTSARPRGRTGATSSTSTSGRSRTRPSLDTAKARDELARITSGYSPAMIDQVCSLALTYAHSDGRPVFSRQDILEAMTTVEAGVAIGQTYPKHESRSIAIHEAGHAVCGHLYMENGMSTRLSIRRRGPSGGHHQIGRDRGPLRALALGGGRRPDLDARRLRRRSIIFYGQNTTGVGGDLHSVTMHAAHMVGARRHGARRRSTSPTGSRTARSARRPREARHRALPEDRLPAHAPLRRQTTARTTRARATRRKRKQVAGLLGQCLRDRLEHDPRQQGRHRDRRRPPDRRRASCTATTSIELLNEARLRKPEIDVLDENAWPVI